jgi:hypothetical protein
VRQQHAASGAQPSSRLCPPRLLLLLLLLLQLVRGLVVVQFLQRHLRGADGARDRLDVLLELLLLLLGPGCRGGERLGGGASRLEPAGAARGVG